MISHYVFTDSTGAEYRLDVNDLHFDFFFVAIQVPRKSEGKHQEQNIGESDVLKSFFEIVVIFFFKSDVECDFFNFVYKFKKVPL